MYLSLSMVSAEEDVPIVNMRAGTWVPPIVLSGGRPSCRTPLLLLVTVISLYFIFHDFIFSLSGSSGDEDFSISRLMNEVPDSAPLTRRKWFRCEGEAFIFNQPEVHLEEHSRSPSRPPSPPPEEMRQLQFHTLIDSQLVNKGLFPGGKLPT